MMSHSLSHVDCLHCQRSFSSIRSGDPCSMCHLCCDCCTCDSDEFSMMQQEVRDIYADDLAALMMLDDPFVKSFESDFIPPVDSEDVCRAMVKIAIWPYTMTDDELTFDPITGSLSDESSQQVNDYLRLNRADSPGDALFHS